LRLSHATNHSHRPSPLSHCGCSQWQFESRIMYPATLNVQGGVALPLDKCMCLHDPFVNRFSHLLTVPCKSFSSIRQSAVALTGQTFIVKSLPYIGSLHGRKPPRHASRRSESFTESQRNDPVFL